MQVRFLVILFLVSCHSFSANDSEGFLINDPVPSFEDVEKSGRTISGRFSPLSGFDRIDSEKNTFSYYLRNLELYPSDKEILLFDGRKKNNQNVHEAVIKMDIGKTDLQQCADAVMRLRAEFLFQQEKYGDLHFHFTNGFDAQFDRWRRGQGIEVKGNRVRWVADNTCNDSYRSFRRYLDRVFQFAGTASLEKELIPKHLDEIAIGDVFIRGGYPGHAVLVVDMAVNKTGKKIFMLAQSYMPAQEMHILKNEQDPAISPWYKLSDCQQIIQTPEWTFYPEQLRSFK